MSLAKPPDDECSRFANLVKSTKEPEVKKYVDKACRAFCDGHLEAAVLLAWAGVERYASLVVNEVGKAYFDFCYNANTRRDPLPYYTVSQLADMSSRSRMFVGFIKPLEKFRQLRHKLAHGTGYFLTRSSEVVDVLQDAQNVFKKLPKNERIVNPEELFKKDKVLFNEKCSFDKSLWRKIISKFPDQVDWENILTMVRERLFSQLDTIWKNFNDPEIAGEPNYTLEQAVFLQNSLLDRVSAFLHAAKESVPAEIYFRQWSNFIEGLLKPSDTENQHGRLFVDTELEEAQSPNFCYYETLCKFMPFPDHFNGFTGSELYEKFCGFLDSVVEAIIEQLQILKEDFDIFGEPKDVHEKMIFRIRDLFRALDPIVRSIMLDDLQTKYQAASRNFQRLRNSILTSL